MVELTLKVFFYLAPQGQQTSVLTISFDHRSNHKPLNNGTLSIRRKTARIFTFQSMPLV